MQSLIAVLIIIVNCIIYLAFGSLICVRKNKSWSMPLTIITGFFLYYALFEICVLPIMLTYRPLSLLTKVWTGFVAVIVIMAVAINGRNWLVKLKEVREEILGNMKIYIAVAVLVFVQIILVTTTYNFTLDAAYYVANVTTCVDTNMINVYDPFTGAWQDHFELRYVFAAYSIHDAVVCQLTKIPALIETKTVMAAIVMLMANNLYVWLCRFFYKDKIKNFIIMFATIMVVNLTCISIYTSSNFLMTRTYEGKAIVGNIAVLAIFSLYALAVRENMTIREWIMLFVICLGTSTVSSTANMVIPAQLCILFVPYIYKRREYRAIPKLILCMLPELMMMLMYVLYVKGYFAIYTYPR